MLDLGCGSGVLAIAAARCWPARVLAVDNDPIAVRVAPTTPSSMASAVHPNLSSATATAIRRSGADGPFDLILANILADPLIELAPALRAHLAPGGRAVLSGLLDRQADAVVAAHRRQGLRLLDQAQQGPWVALVFAAGRS